MAEEPNPVTAALATQDPAPAAPSEAPATPDTTTPESVPPIDAQGMSADASAVASQLGRVSENFTDTKYTLKKVAACANPDKGRVRGFESEIERLKKELDEEKRRNRANTELIKLLQAELDKMEQEGNEIRNLLDEILEQRVPE